MNVNLKIGHFKIHFKVKHPEHLNIPKWPRTHFLISLFVILPLKIIHSWNLTWSHLPSRIGTLLELFIFNFVLKSLHVFVDFLHFFVQGKAILVIRVELQTLSHFAVVKMYELTIINYIHRVIIIVNDKSYCNIDGYAGDKFTCRSHLLEVCRKYNFFFNGLQVTSSDETSQSHTI